jgi:hypothetical protein
MNSSCANERTLAMATLPMKQPVPIADIATALQTRDDAKRAFYIGIDTRSPTHDYTKLHYILLYYRAEKVSTRIWMIAIDPGDQELAVSLVRHCLDVDDEMLVADVPMAIDAVRDRIAA